jgi:hypothetical protein
MGNKIKVDKFTWVIAKKIDEILDSQEINSEEKVALIKYYMDKWRNS